MITGKPSRTIKDKKTPCVKQDCIFYQEWGIVLDVPDNWLVKANLSSTGNIVIGNETCTYCKHFQPFDLYKVSRTR